jgi:hypothetical protein
MSKLWRSLARITASLLLGFASHGAAQAQSNSEAGVWSQARKANTADAYQEYLSLYPLGQYSQEAFSLMIRLSQIAEISPEAGEQEADEPEARRAGRRESDPPDRDSY